MNRCKYRMTIWCTFVSAVVLFGPATGNSDPGSKTRLQLKYGYFDRNLHREKTAETREDLVIDLESIPGRFFGNPTDDLILKFPVRDDKSVDLLLPANVERVASTFSRTGVSVMPPDVRLLRMGTFHSYLKDGRALGGGGGFIVGDKEHPAALMYFSKACQIVGDNRMSSGKTHTYDVEIPADGWHWIRFVERPDGGILISRYEDSDERIEFCVVVD